MSDICKPASSATVIQKDFCLPCWGSPQTPEQTFQSGWSGTFPDEVYTQKTIFSGHRKKDPSQILPQTGSHSVRLRNSPSVTSSAVLRQALSTLFPVPATLHDTKRLFPALTAHCKKSFPVITLHDKNIFSGLAWILFRIFTWHGKKSFSGIMKDTGVFFSCVLSDFSLILLQQSEQSSVSFPEEPGTLKPYPVTDSLFLSPSLL